MTVPEYCTEPGLYPSCLTTNNGKVTHFCSHFNDCARFTNDTEFQKAQSILVGNSHNFEKAQPEIFCVGSLCSPNSLFDYGKTEIPSNYSKSPSATPYKSRDVMSTLLKFLPNLDQREPTETPDNYRILPEALWSNYPEALRTSLDAGLIKLSELAPAKQQLEAINHLKSKGQWHNLPLIIRLAVFFGREDKISLADSEEKVREDMQQKSLEAFKVEALAWEAKKRLQKMKQEAREQALKERYRPKTEEQFYNEIFSHKIQELMK